MKILQIFYWILIRTYKRVTAAAATAVVVVAWYMFQLNGCVDVRLPRWKTKYSNWHQMYILFFWAQKIKKISATVSSQLEDQRNIVAAISFSTAEQSRFAPFFMVVAAAACFFHVFLLFLLHKCIEWNYKECMRVWMCNIVYQQ